MYLILPILECKYKKMGIVIYDLRISLFKHEFWPIPTSSMAYIKLQNLHK